MHLRQIKRDDGRVVLAAAETLTDDGGVEREETVVTFGVLDKLREDHPDPIAHFREVVAGMDARAQAQETTTVFDGFAEKAERDNGGNYDGDIRYLSDVLVCWWLDELGIEEVLQEQMAGRKRPYNLYEVLKLLVCDRLENPGFDYRVHECTPDHFVCDEIDEYDLIAALCDLDRLSERVTEACERVVRENARLDLSEGRIYYARCYFKVLHERGVPFMGAAVLEDKYGTPLSYEIIDDVFGFPPVPDRWHAGIRDLIAIADDEYSVGPRDIGEFVKRRQHFVLTWGAHEFRPSPEMRECMLDPHGYQYDHPTRCEVKAPKEYRGVRLDDLGVPNVDEDYGDTLVRVGFSHGPERFEKDWDERRWRRLTIGDDDENIEDAPELDGLSVTVTNKRAWGIPRLCDCSAELRRVRRFFEIDSFKTDELWRVNNVRAHFLVSFLALLVMRLLAGSVSPYYTYNDVKDVLQILTVRYCDNGKWLCRFWIPSAVELFETIGIEPDAWMTTDEIREYFVHRYISWDPSGL